MEEKSSFVLTEDGNPGCSVVVGSREDREDMYSAGRLVKAVEEITGVHLPILGCREETGLEGKILVGSCARHPLVREVLGVDGVLAPLGSPETSSHTRLLTSEALGSQGFVIHRATFQGKPHLVLAGHTPQGTFYAVNTLIHRLQKKAGRLVVEGLNTRLIPRVSVPAFRYRSIATNIGGPDWLGHNQWEKEWGDGNGYDYRGFIDWLAGHKINHLSNTSNPTGHE